jgi:single-strand DNA-binding protein
MAGETVITVIGNLTGDPELRFTPSGAAVANFRVASTPRTFDRESNQWKDGDPLFLQCSVWRQYAENVAESLTKGMQVIVQGRLKQRSYQAQSGEERTVFELDVDEVGPCLKFATAKVTKANRGSGGGGGGYNGGNAGGGGSGGGAGAGGWNNGPSSGGGPVQRSGGQQSGGPSSAPQDDPWATSGGSGGNSGGGWGGGYSDEPPF